MPTQHSRVHARLMISPAVLLLLGWMLIPLGLTVYFSLLRYNLLMPGMEQWTGITNYRYFLTDPAFFDALRNTLVLVVGVLAITVIGGVLLALLLDQPFWGRGIVRVLVIAPFFIMPTVSALVWKNMFMNPVSGLFAHAAKGLGLEPFDFLAHAPLFLDHPDGELAVAAVRHPDPAHRAAIARQRAARSLRDGRGELLESVSVHRAAASRARHHSGDPDPDDLPVVDLCRNPGDHERGSRHGFHQSDLPDLCPVAPALRCRRWARRAGSSPSSWPTSSRSS